MFTDGARVVGELSYTLDKPVYTDQMILQKMSEQLGVRIIDLQERLFDQTHKTGNLGIDKEKLIELTRHYLDQIQSDVTDFLYYGFFTSLIDSGESFTQKILIFADIECRIKRAERQEYLTESKAERAVREHDSKAACWTRFLHDRDPYHPDLFDTVVTYECQDLFDVISYIYMSYDDHCLKHSLDCLRSL